MKHPFVSKFSFLLVLAVLLSVAGCNKERATVVKNATVTNNTTYFFRGLLSGEVVELKGTPIAFSDANAVNGDVDGDNDHDATMVDHDDDASQYITGGKWTGTLDGTTVTTGSVGVRRLAVRVYVAPINRSHERYKLIAPGFYNYSNRDGNSSGAFLTIRDSKGVLWSTKGDQTGSYFQITSRGDSTSTTATFAGVFTAKFYDGTGNVKTITNGTFSSVAGL